MQLVYNDTVYGHCLIHQRNLKLVTACDVCFGARLCNFGEATMLLLFFFVVVVLIAPAVREKERKTTYCVTSPASEMQTCG